MRLLLVFAIFLLSSQCTEAENFDLPAIAKAAEPHVFQIETYDSDGKAIKTGTGFFGLGSTGVVGITNAHVIEGSDKVICTLWDGTKMEASGVTGYSTESDIAVLAFSYPPAESLQFETENVVVGQQVAVLGNPLDFGNTLSNGIVSAIRKNIQGVPIAIQITAPISHGSSGSPVLNSNGKVIGVAFLTVEGGQALNFAISVEITTSIISTSAVPVRTFNSLHSQKDLSQKQKITQQVTDGTNAIKSGDIGRAIKLLQDTLAEDPHNVLAAVNLSNAYLKADLAAKATALAEALVVEAPTDPDSWVAFADCAAYQNNWNFAEKRLLSAVKLDPYCERAWNRLVVVYKMLNSPISSTYCQERAKKVKKFNDAGTEEIRIPFNLKWNETSKQLIESMKYGGSTGISGKDQLGRLKYTIANLPQRLLSKSAFYFVKDKLSEIELLHGDSSWNELQWNTFNAQTKVNIEGKYGPGICIFDERNTEQNTTIGVRGFIWRQDDTSLILIVGDNQQSLNYFDSKSEMLQTRITSLEDFWRSKIASESEPQQN